jgi:hypothetical protein
MTKDPINKIKDEYERNARLKPALLAILPLCAAAMQFGFTVSGFVAALAGPLSAIGLTFLLAEISRDGGKRREPVLYKLWGGKPSVAKLRHSSNALNAITRERYHAVAAKLLSRRIPTPEDERADPVAADIVYEAYSNLLLEKTRDHAKFRLIFEELIRYGFRRNLWGLKPIAIVLVSVCCAGEITVIAFLARRGGSWPVPATLALALDLLLLCCWLWVITPEWVRRSAESYADRLLAASEVLASASAKKSPKSRSITDNPGDLPQTH